MNESDEPSRISSDDIDGLRGDTRDLTASVNRLAKRQTETESKVSATEAQIVENRRLSKRANVNSIVAIAALALVVVALAIGWNANRAQRDRDAADVLARRTADCHSLGDIAEANITGANRIVTNPANRDAYAAGMREAFDAVKRAKGYSADCSVIGQPPGK